MNTPLKLTNISDIVAAIPALLGFVPTASFVAILLHDDDGELIVRCVLRGDLDVSPDAVTNLPATSRPAFHGVDTVILVAICGEWLDDQARTTLDALRTGIESADIAVRARILTRDITQHGHWLNIDTGKTGAVYPYTDAILSAETVRRGRNIAKTRNQIAAEFACTTNPVPVISEDPGTIVMATLEEIAAATTSHNPPSPSLATRAGIVITHNVRLRDAALLVGAEHPEAAAGLWTAIATQLSAEARIHALTIAAAHYYISSDAVRAGIALEIADNEATATDVAYPTLAVLLSTALHAGLSPTDIRAALLRILGPDS